jgi:hypothetical protein
MEKSMLDLPNYFDYTPESCALARQFLRVHNIEIPKHEDGFVSVLRANKKVGEIRRAFKKAETL